MSRGLTRPVMGGELVEYNQLVEALALRIQYKPVEAHDEPSPTGLVSVERGPQRAVLLTPGEIDPERSYPLITVLHGAGRQDEQWLISAEHGGQGRWHLLGIEPAHGVEGWVDVDPERT